MNSFFSQLGQWAAGALVFCMFIMQQGCLAFTVFNPSDAKSVYNAKVEVERKHQAQMIINKGAK